MLQVLSTEQWATLCVQSYPYFCNLELVFEGMAQEHSGSTMSEVLAAARQNALQNEWEALDEYVSYVTKQYYPKHVPIFRPTSPAVPQALQDHSRAKGTSLAHMHQMLL